MRSFLTKYAPQYYIIWGWPNLQMQNHRYWELTVNLYTDFWLQGCWQPQLPGVVQCARAHSLNKNYVRSSIVVRQKQTQLVSVRMQVRSLALLNGSVIWSCHELWCRSQTQLRSHVAMTVVYAGSWSSDSTPSLETSICRGYGPKKEKKKKSYVHLTTYLVFSQIHPLWL